MNRSPVTGHRSRRSFPTAEPPPKHPRDRLRRELTFLDATMLVVSSVIGVGIFLTPGTIAASLPAPGLILAGVDRRRLALAGRRARQRRARAMYPHAGGDYVYLREAYHPVAGFLAGWLSFFVIYAGHGGHAGHRLRRRV
jgi:APA family basic amino acid/polyamine antiporter